MPERVVRARTLDPVGKEQVLQKATLTIAAHPEVVFAYLHGSFVAEGAFRDLDVAIYLDPGAVANDGLRGYECDLASAISREVKIPVDVRILNDAPPAFRYHALKGRLLMARDHERLDEFRARTWDDYLDFAPFASQYLREVLSE